MSLATAVLDLSRTKVCNNSLTQILTQNQPKTLDFRMWKGDCSLHQICVCMHAVYCCILCFALGFLVCQIPPNYPITNFTNWVGGGRRHTGMEKQSSPVSLALFFEAKCPEEGCCAC